MFCLSDKIKDVLLVYLPYFFFQVLVEIQVILQIFPGHSMVIFKSTALTIDMMTVNSNLFLCTHTLMQTCI